MKIAISKETNAIDKFERRMLSKKYGAKDFMVQPSKIIGTVPNKIDFNNFLCIKSPTTFFEDCLLN